MDLLLPSLLLTHATGMLELQTSKRELAAAALSGQATKNVMKLTLNDIMGGWYRRRVVSLNAPSAALFRATGE